MESDSQFRCSRIWRSGVVPEIKWYEETPWNNKPNSMIVTLPPLSGIILKQTEKLKEPSKKAKKKKNKMKNEC